MIHTHRAQTLSYYWLIAYNIYSSYETEIIICCRSNKIPITRKALSHDVVEGSSASIMISDSFFGGDKDYDKELTAKVNT